MPTSNARITLMIAALLSGFFAQANAQQKSMEQIESDVARLVAPLIDSRSVVGLSIGLIDGDRTASMSFGHVDYNRFARPTSATLYEIGSVTKAFTGILLADAVERGRMKLDDPVANYLPDSIRSTAFGRAGITLLDLATHYSGLPGMPVNFEPGDPGNPYVDYSAERLLSFLSTWTPEVKPGTRYEYSNLGMGLLGWVLSQQSNTDYAGLLRRIVAPLGMSGTTLALSPEASTRMAEGHDADLERVPNWDFDALAGAGAIRSSVDDMLMFMQANLGITKTSLRSVLDFAQVSRRPLPEGGSIALGWHMLPGGKVLWHNGGTAGFHSLFAFDREKRKGVVIFGNTSTALVEKLGFDLLKLLAGAKVEPMVIPQTVALDTTQLERLTGDYQFTPTITMTIARQRDRLFAQLGDQGPLRIYPSSPTEFFLRAVDARLSFVAGADGRIEKLVLHQEGVDQEATRIR